VFLLALGRWPGPDESFPPQVCKQVLNRPLVARRAGPDHDLFRCVWRHEPQVTLLRFTYLPALLPGRLLDLVYVH